MQALHYLVYGSVRKLYGSLRYCKSIEILSVIFNLKSVPVIVVDSVSFFLIPAVSNLPPTTNAGIAVGSVIAVLVVVAVFITFGIVLYRNRSKFNT